MESLTAKSELIRQLQKEILSLQGFKGTSNSQRLHTGLGIIEQSFAGHVFPMGAVHEFLSNRAEEAAATMGFMAALLSCLMKGGGACLWISTKRTLFPPALKAFGIEPERVIFIDLNREKDILWSIEEALKCDLLAAVVGELKELSFTQSRRLQLAVEQSHVTGFIHRYQPKAENVVACVTRWKISPLTSRSEEGMPGVGVPRWQVQLVKSRNGLPGSWQLEWSGNTFRHIPIPVHTMSISASPAQQTG